MNFQSCIEIKDILNACFIEKKEKMTIIIISTYGKYYYFDKIGIIFVNVRIGLDEYQKNIIKE